MNRFCRKFLQAAVMLLVGLAVVAPGFAQEAKAPAKKAPVAQKSDALNEALSRIDRLEAQIVEMQSVIGALQSMVQKNGVRAERVDVQPEQKFTPEQQTETPQYRTDGWGVDTQSELEETPPPQQMRGADIAIDGPPPRSEVKLNGKSPRALYDAGYNYMMASDYKSAEATFQSFLSNYPQDELSGNAQYWLGEVYFARGDYRRAANEFLKGYKNYRKSPKAPDNLLKLGMSLRLLGQGEAACQTFSELKSRYKSLPGHIDRKLSDERGKVGCS